MKKVILFFGITLFLTSCKDDLEERYCECSEKQLKAGSELREAEESRQVTEKIYQEFHQVSKECEEIFDQIEDGWSDLSFKEWNEELGRLDQKCDVQGNIDKYYKLD